jgi:hypothetical protein
MEIKSDISMDDHQAFTRYVWYSGARGSWLWFVLIFLAVVAISVLLQVSAGIRLDTTTMLVTMVILTGYLALAQRRIRPDADGASLGERTFELSREGIWERSHHYDTLTRWSGVREIDETRDYVFVFIDNCQAHIIPKRAFTDPSHCGRFVAELRRHAGSKTATTVSTPVAQVAGAS